MTLENHRLLHCGGPKVVVIIDVLLNIKWLPPLYGYIYIIPKYIHI